ncbi:MAG: type II toxin-antitoxin system RelE/ParE family toxin [Methylotenera sp.]|jgi:toxin ParE1/3/4|uniref:type II toxin-antitoxin system RelE/ParE family toxin n=1 Tax=Methylotenera sp. TaxID=2051956 RepID=UPI002717A8A7|nr:type II toxin-antitoxin system RelE/ParE family toxin [Methylotenera sp.]MDO9204353.1 type II toxin-antitoxin system RelE/ParE family toxin [Methylotenera sp.]MDO9393918.1 type II toxin-antitoxin system RelE/ParE family toxin [Methylotenera sp.]MDP1522546.1 type II toxin-antitoxin system RelE/ParE family toxin [Methylotenera sp.]MDP3308574.1 type II toxin-antitoxin system RelE/ParE family toxin [Methylotenera sp.]
MLELRFTAFARDDLLQILQFIALDNPKRAQSFVAELRQQCQSLAQFPNMGVAKPEYADGIRMLAYQRYLIFFSVQESKSVLIERVLHSARNISDILLIK